MRKEHTFQCQKTYEVHEGTGLASHGTHEAKSTWHCLGAQAANGSALAMPHCQKASTSCPKYTHSPQDVSRPREKLYHVSWHAKWWHHPTRGIYDSLYTWTEFRNPGISRKIRWVAWYRKQINLLLNTQEAYLYLINRSQGLVRRITFHLTQSTE